MPNKAMTKAMKQRWAAVREAKEKLSRLQAVEKELAELRAKHRVTTVSVTLTEEEAFHVVTSLRLASESMRNESTSVTRSRAFVFEDLARKVDGAFQYGAVNMQAAEKLAVENVSVAPPPKRHYAKRGPYKKRAVHAGIPRLPKAHPLKGRKMHGAKLRAIRKGIEKRWAAYRAKKAAQTAQPSAQQVETAISSFS